MRHHLLRIALCSGTALASGCVVLPETQTAIGGARYEELVRLAEAEVPDMANARTLKLVRLCIAYSKTKRYDRLFACADHLEANIRRGDRGAQDPNEARDHFRELAPVLDDLGAMAAVQPIARGRMNSRQTAVGWILDAAPVPHLIRAEAMIDLGQYAEAVREAETASRLISSKSSLVDTTPALVSPLTTAAVAAALNGEAQRAGEFIERLKQIELEKGLAGVGLRRARREGLVKAHIALKDYPQALAFLDDRKDEDDTLAGLSQSALARLLLLPADLLLFRGAISDTQTGRSLPGRFLLAKCQFETGRIAEAKSGYDGLLEVPQIQQNGEMYWPILYDRGRIAEREGKRKEAIGFFRRAIEVIERQRSTINPEASKIGFVGDKQQVYRDLVAALVEDGRHSTAFEYVERSKARALVDMLASQQNFFVSTANVDQVRALLAMGESAEREERIQIAAGQAPAQSRALAAQATRQLRAQAPQLASLVSVTYSSVAEIQQRLPDDEVLLEFYYDERNAFAFVLTRADLRVVRLDAAGLEEEVRQLRSQLEPPPREGHLELSQKLYRRLLAPVRDWLDRPKLLVVAHGALHYLPWGALHSGSEYLVERYALRILPSASVTRFLPVFAGAKPGGLLAFGNPDLGDPRYDLVHAEAEARTVARMVPVSRALARDQATKDAFRKYAGGFRYLHFATHGEFNARHPLRSAIRLAPSGLDDGALTVAELYSTRLDVDLVTLSACETGLGRISSGDDVVGLTRGFLYAGASSIVASLWKVDDLATAYLMSRFYEKLADGDKGDALRKAQLETKAKFAHPYFWASFQLMGNEK
jgi:CHAT domain-containing protein